MPRWRSWALLNLVYPDVRGLARARDVDGLLRLLEQSPDPAETQFSQRAVTAAALGWLRANAAIPHLAALVGPTERVDVRICAADALRRIGGPEAAEALRPALNDERYAVKKAAIDTVSLEEPETQAKLAELAQSDPERLIRGEALEALARTETDQWVPLLRAAAQNDGLIPAISAMYALDHMRTPGASEALAELRRKTSGTRRIYLAWRRLLSFVRRVIDR